MSAMPPPGVAVSIAGYVIAVAGLASLAFSRALFTTQPVLLTIQVLAFLLMIWARVTFGRRSFHVGANPTAGGIVTTGPYRFWRHPIYAAILLFAWAGVLSHGLDPIALGLAVVATLMTAVRIASEEHYLRAEFPGENGYDAYARRTKRLVPFVF